MLHLFKMVLSWFFLITVYNRKKNKDHYIMSVSIPVKRFWRKSKWKKKIRKAVRNVLTSFPSNAKNFGRFCFEFQRFTNTTCKCIFLHNDIQNKNIKIKKPSSLNKYQRFSREILVKDKVMTKDSIEVILTYCLFLLWEETLLLYISFIDTRLSVASKLT